MKFDIQSYNKYIVASDTDSSFISLKPILEKNHSIKIKNRIIPVDTVIFLC